MKTIEEIAIESRRYHKDESFKKFNEDLTFRMDDWAYGYCQGATEQDPISYLRGRNDALKEMADVMAKNKKEMMEKLHRACVKVESEHYKTLGFLYKWLTEAIAEE